MRDIGSKSVTGPEAVLCVAISWWLSGFSLDKIVLHALDGVPPSDMWSRRPEDLAAALSHRVPWDRVNSHFWASAQSVPAVKHMVEEAVRSWRGEGKVREAKQFVASSILREAGEMVLSSGFLEEHEAEIKAARAARRRRK